MATNEKDQVKKNDTKKNAAKNDVADDDSKPPAPPPLPPISPEHRKICATLFEKANNAIAAGAHSYAIDCLQTCCKLDPGNFQYRQLLRKTQKSKYPNKHGSSMAFLTTFGFRAKLKKAKRSRDHLKVLQFGEEIMSRNPWDLEVQLDMGAAADAAGLSDIAVFILDQARQKFPKNATLNRQLARLFEKRGNFSHAITLWTLVKEVAPKDVEAQHKSKNLAASETIQRGGYDSGEKPALPLSSGGTAAAKTNKKEEKPIERVDREAAIVLGKIQTSPGDPNLYKELAAVYRRYNQPDRAREALERGLGPTGAHYSLTLELMEMDIEPFRKDLAITEDKLRKIGKKAPDDDDEESTHYQLQQNRVKLLKEISAREIELYRMKTDRYPLDSSFRLELGSRLLQAGQIDEAVKELQQARKDTKMAGRASILLGMCFLKANNWRLAQRNFEEALNLLPSTDEDNRKEVLFQLAKGHAESGDLAKAIELGHELANLEFSYKSINKLIDDWQEKLQQA